MTDPTDLDLPACALIEAQGQRLAVIERGTGRPTVLLHGGGPGCSAWTDFGPVVPALSARRRTVLVDLLQYGRSTKPVTDEPYYAWQASHLISVLDALGIDRADFVCGSVGGSVALLLAAEQPERVRRLVVSGSTPTLQGWEQPDEQGSAEGMEAFSRYYLDDGPTPAKMRRLLELMEWHDPARIPDALVDLRLRQSADPELVRLGAGLTDGWNLEDLHDVLPSVSAPVLFVYGRRDPFATPGYVQLLADRVQHGHVHVMADVSHHLAEERPAAFAAVVEAFLDAEDDASAH